MKNIDDQKLLADLVKRAEAGEHTKFELIKAWHEYKYYKTSCRAVEMLIDSIRRSAKQLFKKYCKAIELGQADVTTLLVRNVLLRTKEFYEKEAEIIFDMITEYEAYLMNGNLLDSFFGEIRPISEMRDFRK
jgi:hypothetical protein